MGRRFGAVVGVAVLLAGCGASDKQETRTPQSSGAQPSDAQPGAVEPSAPTASEPSGGEGSDLPVLDDPYGAAKAAIEQAGLEICKEYPGSGDISGSYDSVSYSIGDATAPCSGDPLETPGYVSVDLYNDADTASAQLAQPETDAYILWLIDPTTLVSTSETDTPEVLGALKDAFADYPVGGPGL